ncbi:MAG: GntR family transcriptional regulator [Lapillicoccus sp.]
MSVEQTIVTPTLTVAPRRSEEITATIARQVRDHELPPGARLPSERQLCERFAASRSTVRRALATLVALDLVRVEHGRGAFVQPPRIGETTNALLSFTELAHARDLTATAQVLRHETRAATIDEAALFGLAPGAPLFVLRRVRMLDGLPVSVDESRVPMALVPGLTAVDFATASLYATLSELGHAPVRATYTIEAAAAGRVLARQLGVRAGAPLLRADTVSVDGQGRTVEHGEMFYRADRYRFHATLSRLPDGSAST